MPELPFLDSFDHYDNAGAVSHGIEKWTNFVGSIGIGTGRRGTNGLQRLNVAQMFRTFTQTYSTLYMGVAYKTPAFTQQIMGFRNDLIPGNLRISHVGDGRLQVITTISPVSGGPFVTTAVINTDVWYYIEFSATVTSTSISFEVRINENSVLTGTFTVTGTPLTTTGWATVTIDSITTLSTNYDDFYCTNSGFYGDIIIGVIRPNGPGLSGQWTPSGTLAGATGNANWQNVDDLYPDDDATIVIASASGIQDLYEMEDIPTNVNVIAAQGLVSARKENSGLSSYKQSWWSSGTLIQAREVYPSEDAYFFSMEGYETSPFTLVAWTPAEINAIQFGQLKTK